MVKSSLSTESAFQWPREMLPLSMSFDSYWNVVTEFLITRWFLNSSFVALVSTALAVLIALNAALALSRYRTRLTGAFGTIILITQMLPATLLVIPMLIIFRNLQLLDSLWGLVVANLAFSLPLAIWVLKGFFDSIPREIEEASMIDGSSEVGAFYRVTIPLALPGFVASIRCIGANSWPRRRSSPSPHCSSSPDCNAI
jgi:ABC-type glycerol-3-phosphate transport system permease component